MKVYHVLEMKPYSYDSLGFYTNKKEAEDRCLSILVLKDMSEIMNEIIIFEGELDENSKSTTN
jgi:hypothetical protein